MHIHETCEKRAGCAQPGTCAKGCAAKAAATATCGLYAAEFMLYAFHFDASAGRNANSRIKERTH